MTTKNESYFFKTKIKSKKIDVFKPKKFISWEPLFSGPSVPQ